MQAKTDKRATNRVLAVYDDHAEAFPLAADAPMWELAERLAALAARSHQRPVHIQVRLAR